ncbi:hypothetical protein AA23498_2650 [Acetobacter nitrogenifigens DSM 23921 = NBRC 105050]|nr:hypothetical protein AA23498_2650 [Acetobacter nitrogenifigens DSM 23921 = NBRC 105050]
MGRISDPRLLKVVQAIADRFGDVTVISGDRDFVPNGGAKESLHLLNEAADVSVAGKTPEQLFELLIAARQEIFGQETGAAFRWQIILHGPGTKTEGHHVHIGYVPPDHVFRRSRPFMGYVVEGLFKGKTYSAYTPYVAP